MWFKDVRAEMRRAGFKVAVYRVVLPLIGKAQVAFHCENAELVELLEIP